MENTTWLTELFIAIDNKDADSFARSLSADAVFCFGNADRVKGREVIRDAVDSFFASIKGLIHDLKNTWAHQDYVVCNGEVTYTRHDNSQITLPFADVFAMNGEKIQEYLIYMDVGPLYDTT